MSRLARLLLFTLVAFWLPVTLHCKLEAAGVFEAPDDCCATEPSATPAGDCKDDACPTVEEALYKESAQGLKLAAPDFSLGFICLELPAPRSLLQALSPARHAPPPELMVGWQFVTRAAPLARAPNRA